MPEVHADPEELKTLAGQLTNQMESLRQLSGDIARALADVDSWQDSKRAQFEEQLEPVLADMDKLAEYASEDLIPWLLNKAESLDCYSAGS